MCPCCSIDPQCMTPLTVRASQLLCSVCVPFSRECGRVRYRGIVHCARKIYRQEGSFAFMKGVVPRALWIAPMAAIQFCAYEYLRKVFGTMDSLVEDF